MAVLMRSQKRQGTWCPFTTATTTATTTTKRSSPPFFLACFSFEWGLAWCEGGEEGEERRRRRRREKGLRRERVSEKKKERMTHTLTAFLFRRQFLCSSFLCRVCRVCVCVCVSLSLDLSLSRPLSTSLDLSRPLSTSLSLSLCVAIAHTCHHPPPSHARAYVQVTDGTR